MQRSADGIKRPLRKNSRQVDDRHASFISLGHRAGMAAIAACSLLLMLLISSYARRATVRSIRDLIIVLEIWSNLIYVCISFLGTISVGVCFRQFSHTPPVLSLSQAQATIASLQSPQSTLDIDYFVRVQDGRFVVGPSCKPYFVSGKHF